MASGVRGDYNQSFSGLGGKLLDCWKVEWGEQLGVSILYKSNFSIKLKILVGCWERCLVSTCSSVLILLT